jgi:hypothetical protein
MICAMTKDQTDRLFDLVHRSVGVAKSPSHCKATTKSVNYGQWLQNGTHR